MAAHLSRGTRTQRRAGLAHRGSGALPGLLPDPGRVLAHAHVPDPAAHSRRAAFRQTGAGVAARKDALRSRGRASVGLEAGLRRRAHCEQLSDEETMARRLLLSLAVAVILAPAVRPAWGQWAVYDAANHFENIRQTVQAIAIAGLGERQPSHEIVTAI